MANASLEMRSVSKTFGGEQNELIALTEISLVLERGESMALTGPSGSGKTTALSLGAGLVQPTQGTVLLLGADTLGESERKLAARRLECTGFVFQFFNLIATAKVWHNVALPRVLRGERLNAVRRDALDLLERVELADRAESYPTELSGGEMQRVAVARALINRPAIVFADEPTGNLDEISGAAVRELLFEASREQGTSLLVATHDPLLAQMCDSEVSLRKHTGVRA